jgi:hypothetical protein
MDGTDTSFVFEWSQLMSEHWCWLVTLYFSIFKSWTSCMNILWLTEG